MGSSKGISSSTLNGQMVNVTILLAFSLLLLLQFCVEGVESFDNPLHGRRPRGSRAALLLSNSKSSTSTPPAVTDVFEVDRPYYNTTPVACTMELLNYNFANTISSPPVVVPYIPDPKCGTQWSSVILKWRSSVTGIQYDRFAAVWMSGVELLRTTTAEPVGDGVIIEWEVEKDISIYSSLLRQNQTLVVSLPNLVSDVYTGVYNTTITATFYASAGNNTDGLTDFLILPISNPSPLNGSYWFNLQKQGDVKSRSLTIPANTYEAFVELYVSFHGQDEFWYATSADSSPPPFREVVLSIDGQLVGAVWPAPVIFTGGFDPQLWTPVVGLGAFKLPTYIIDISPFLGTLVDNKPHTFSIDVVNALDFWLLDANLFLLVDDGGAPTIGKLIHYFVPSYNVTVTDMNATTGTYLVQASRTISAIGYVVSSKTRNITYSSGQTLEFRQTQTASSGIYDQITKLISYSRLTTNSTGESLIAEGYYTAVYPVLFSLGTGINFWNRSFVTNSDFTVNRTEAGIPYSTVFREYTSDTQVAQESSPWMHQTYNYYHNNKTCFNRELEIDTPGHFAFDKANTICIDPPKI